MIKIKVKKVLIINASKTQHLHDSVLACHLYTNIFAYSLKLWLISSYLCTLTYSHSP